MNAAEFRSTRVGDDVYINFGNAYREAVVTEIEGMYLRLEWKAVKGGKRTRKVLFPSVDTREVGMRKTGRSRPHEND